MSQKGSSAKVIKVKGVSLNALQFFWSKMAVIRQAEESGEYGQALKLATSFIKWLPDSFKDTFRYRAEAIEREMNLIKADRLPQLTKVSDPHKRGMLRRRILQSYAANALTRFMDDLTTQFNVQGYMENIERKRRGEAQPSFVYAQQREQKKRQRESSAPN